MGGEEPLAFLEGLLGKTLHITVADGRLLTGVSSSTGSFVVIDSCCYKSLG